MYNSDIIVIGSGPGGMEVAAGALRRGLSVTLIERERLGGTCLNRGCIPTKALCSSASLMRAIGSASDLGVDVSSFSLDYNRVLDRKEQVVNGLRDNVAMMLSKAHIIEGEARFTDSRHVEVNGKVYAAPRIVIATGSSPASLDIPGADLAIDSDAILELKELPASIVIIGGGVIGMEFACILSAFGVDVTVIEYCKEILPGFDKDIAKRLRSSLSRLGVKIITGAQVTSIAPGKKVGYTVKGNAATVEAAEVLMAVGRRPVIPEGVEAAGINVERGAIVTDETFATTVPGIYAIGDVNARMMLAHVASAQAAAVMGDDINLSVVPAVAFTLPECAMVGLTEERCKESGLNYKAVKSLFRANGKAQAMGDTDGLLKLIVDVDSRLILGCHVCGCHAADLVQEAALAMSAGVTVDNVASAIHAHPSLSEILHSAAAACR